MDGSVGGKSELLNLLGDVKARVQDRLGVVDFPLPQFILIGKQSVGKSRLIEALAGETFNFVSGSLGSRRPTVLEFSNVAGAEKARWFVRDMDTEQKSWEERPVADVMKIVGQKHEECGEDVSEEPVFVRIESPGCVDMQIVDLPGFRDFALNESKQAFAKRIEDLDFKFMADPRNVILCVEQCGDAATMSSLAKAREFDPQFKRTVLIRNNLDKYYSDLSPENVVAWVDGHGDLPEGLDRFALTLPFWKDGEAPPKPLPEISKDMNAKDLQVLKDKGLPENMLKTVGFNSFVSYMEKRIEKLFVASVNPVLQSLKEHSKAAKTKKHNAETEMKDTDPAKILETTRQCGTSFAESVNHVMEGEVGTVTVWTLKEELEEFHQVYAGNDNMIMLPSTDFFSLQDYLDYLENEIELYTFSFKLNAGAQFRRLMQEVEIFLRFSEVADSTKKKDVIQARGVSMTSLGWRDVVVKILSHQAHLPLKQRLTYVGERIRFFFQMQKVCVLEFMGGLDNPGGKAYASSLSKHYQLITENQVIKNLIFDTYDSACKRQMTFWLDLFGDMLTSMFADPWVFMKRASGAGEAEDDEDGPGTGSALEITTDELRVRVPDEIKNRSGTEEKLQRWLSKIPEESTAQDEAVECVQMLILKTYEFIRAHVCDQVEMLTDTFFKTPMLRKLPDDMLKIEISEDDQMNYQLRRQNMEKEITSQDGMIKEVDDCIAKITQFKVKNDALDKWR